MTQPRETGHPCPTVRLRAHDPRRASAAPRAWKTAPNSLIPPELSSMNVTTSHDCHPESRLATSSRRLRAAAPIEDQSPSLERAREAFAPAGSRGDKPVKVTHELRRTLGSDRGTEYQKMLRSHRSRWVT
jgi:hypothetical protein